MNQPLNVSQPISDALSSFSERTVTALVEFSKQIAVSDSDLTICMARKASRIFDLLAASGCAVPSRPPLHHYFLEHAIEKAEGKNVTLVDDTVILGTSLGKAKRELIEAGAKSVRTVVLAVDRDHWSKDLIVPDVSFLDLKHHDMLSLCAAEVQALNRAGIPYLSDFPFFEPLVITADSFSRMQGQFSWEVHPVSHRFDAPSDPRVSVFSILPSDTIKRDLDRVFGRQLAHALEISKIRCFGVRNDDGKYVVRLVPLTTFAPLKVSAIESLFDTIVSRFEVISGRKLSRIANDLSTAKSKLRFVQYITSVIVGTLYTRNLVSVLGLDKRPKPELIEAERIFGYWAKSELSTCHDFVSKVCERGLGENQTAVQVKRTSLPISVTSVSEEECKRFLGIDGASNTETNVRSLRSDLENIFLKLHQVHELPAREEVKVHGQGVFDAPASQVPHRDRLGFGLDWGTVAKTLLRRESLQPTPQRRAKLSVLLDQLVDDGIAVPLLAERDGVVFRAYRYGEDVEFANQECSLSHDTISGYMETSGRTAVPRLTTEKLLVALLRVGTQRRFLSPVHGVVGASGGTAQVGYHLHGAVAMLPGDDSPLADSSDSWLSRYLVNEGVLRAGKNKSYELGRRPEAANIVSSAPYEAKQLGNIIGLLTTEKDRSGKPGLTENELVLLTTCPQSRHVALASVAELNIILEGIQGRMSRWVRHKLTKERCQVLLEKIRSDNARTAIFSAMMKIRAHQADQVRTIIDTSEAFLRSIPKAGPMLSNYWSASWRPIIDEGAAHQRSFFDQWISDLHRIISDHALGILTVELALASRLHDENERKTVTQFRNTCNAIKRVLPDLKPSPESHRLFNRLQDATESLKPISNTEQSVRFGVDFCMKRRVSGHALVRQVCEANTSYGRTDRRTDFDFVLWYDIVDSTGRKSDLESLELDAYRTSVLAFKDGMNSAFEVLSRDFKSRGVVMYPWASGISAKDDERNVFFSGPRCFTALTETLRLLLKEAQAKGVWLRLLALNTDFSGYSAHKYELKPSVDGEAFWAHYHKLKRELKKLETTAARQSYLWLADKAASSSIQRNLHDLWSDQRKGELNSSVDNYPMHTRYLGGEVQGA